MCGYERGLLFAWTLIPTLFALIDLFFIGRQINLANNQAALRSLITLKPESLPQVQHLLQDEANFNQVEIVIKLMLGTIFSWLLYVVISTYWEQDRPHGHWHGQNYHYFKAPKSAH